MKNSRLLQILVVLSIGVIGACSAPGRSYVKSEMTETLETDIRVNASKMFVYRLKWPENLMPVYIRVENGNGSSRPVESGGVSVGRDTYERLLRNATYVVERSGYCREGFLALDHSMSRYHLWVKGECKEGATDADRKKFGEMGTLTAKDWAVHN